MWDSLQVHSADVSEPRLSWAAGLQQVVGLQYYSAYPSHRRTILMLYRHRNQGAGTFGQVCPPRPWINRKRLSMWTKTKTHYSISLKKIYILLWVSFLFTTHLSTTKSLLGWGGMRLRTYWNTSVCLSSVSHTFHCSRSTSHRWRSRSTRFNTTDGGASTSTDTRQRLKGFPSPTWRNTRKLLFAHIYAWNMKENNRRGHEDTGLQNSPPLNRLS